MRTSLALIAVASLAAAATVQSQTLRPSPSSSWGGPDITAHGFATRLADPLRPSPLHLPLVSLYQRNLLNGGAPGLRPAPTPASTLAVDIFMASADAAPSLLSLRNPDFGTPASSATRFALGPQLSWHWSDDTAQNSWRVALPLQGVFSAQGSVAPRSFSLGPELIYERRTSNWRYGASLGAQLGERATPQGPYGYGILPGSVNTAASTLERRGLTSWRLGLSASRSLSSDWQVFTYALLDSPRSPALSSLAPTGPGLTLGAGVAWTWMPPSPRSGAD